MGTGKDIIYLGVILLIAIFSVVLFDKGPESTLRKLAHIGGVGWLLWLILQIVKWLLAN